MWKKKLFHPHKAGFTVVEALICLALVTSVLGVILLLYQNVHRYRQQQEAVLNVYAKELMEVRGYHEVIRLKQESIELEEKRQPAIEKTIRRSIPFGNYKRGVQFEETLHQEAIELLHEPNKKQARISSH